jgi:phage terminase large subunit
VDIKLTKKQSIAFKYLMDNSTKEVLFGSGAGSGKSFLGCLWVTHMCLKYEGVRYLIGRSVLTQLRLTTLKTLFDLFKIMSLENGVHYTYNQQTNVVKFHNGSEIILKDMASSPSDPEFDSLGSLEITGAFLDEMTQISQIAYNIIKSRLRYKLDEYNLIGKLFMSCNPGNNYLKREFYIPFIEGKLEDKKKFIMATAMDNPFLPSDYIETLQDLPLKQKQRLLFGNWDYDDDINNIFNFEKISKSIYKFHYNEDDTTYMSIDVSRFGEDRSCIVVWKGNCIISIKTYNKLSTTQLTEKIKGLIEEYGVHPRNIVIDADGVGGGVVDQIKSSSFVNNSKPLNNENFINLKSQCYHYLGNMFNEEKISININDVDLIDQITEELMVVKYKNIEKDNKIMVSSKDEQKKLLGRSPDIADAIMMGMYFKINNKKVGTGNYSIVLI